MKINIDYKEGIASIDETLSRLTPELQEQEKTVLRKIGNIIKKNAKQYMIKSDIERRAKDIPPSNYDGSRPYIHMKDDIKMSVRKDKQGNHYVSVRGGKMTGYKWGPVSDGHIARDGTTFVPGNRFMAKTVQASEPEIDKLIDEMLKAVADD